MLSVGGKRCGRGFGKAAATLGSAGTPRLLHSAVVVWPRAVLEVMLPMGTHRGQQEIMKALDIGHQ